MAGWPRPTGEDRSGQRRVAYELTRSDDQRLMDFEAAHLGQRWCLGTGVGGSCACGTDEAQVRPGPAVIASYAGEREPIAAARITTFADAPGHGHLAVSAPAQSAHTPLVHELLASLAQAARAAGIGRLRACIVYAPNDVLRECQAAGMHVESALNVGGITEAVLKLD